MSETRGKSPVGDLGRAMRAAKLKAMDTPRALNQVTRILQESCEMDEASARIVAEASRANTFAKLAQEYGLSDDDTDTIGEGDDDSFMDGSEDDFSDEDSADDEDGDDLAPSPFSGGHDNLSGGVTDEDDTFGDDPSGDTDDVSSMGSDDDLVDVHLKVPANEVDEIDAFLEQILGHGLGDQSDDSHLSDDDSFEGFQGSPVDHAGGEGSFDENDTSDEDFDDSDDAFGADADDETPTFSPSKVASSRGYSMSNNPAYQQRRAHRKALLGDARNTRVASDEVKPKDIGLGSDTSHGGKPFQFSENAQYKGEAKTPTKTLEDSSGNSLQGDNPTFPKRKLYTKNPEHLMLGEAYEASNFEGGNGDGELEYEVKFDRPHIPSAGEANRLPSFELPTQNPSMTSLRVTDGAAGRLASINDVDEEFEKHMFDVLEAAGYSERQLVAMTLDQGLDAYNNVVTAATATAKQSDWFKENVLDKKHKNKEEDEDEDEDDMEEVGGTKESKRRSGINKKSKELALTIEAGRNSGDPRVAAAYENELHRIAEELRADYARSLDHEIKRVKAAFSVNSQLLANGILRPDELDGHVEMWLDSGMDVRAMYTQGELMLRTAATLRKSSAASNSEVQSTRVASRGITQNPQIVAQPSNHRFASAIDQEANQLSGLFSIGNVSRDAFERTLAYEDAKARNPYLGLHNPYLD